jgi:hypothetical protein
MHVRLIVGNANVTANIAAGATQAVVWNNGTTTLEVPTDFAFMVTVLATSLLSGGISFDLAERDASGNIIRSYKIAAGNGGQNISPPIAFKSGSRVTCDITNNSLAVGGSPAIYTVFGVLVPSIDFDETKYPENIPPYFPRPW